MISHPGNLRSKLSGISEVRYKYKDPGYFLSENSGMTNCF